MLGRLYFAASSRTVTGLLTRIICRPSKTFWGLEFPPRESSSTRLIWTELCSGTEQNVAELSLKTCNARPLKNGPFESKMMQKYFWKQIEVESCWMNIHCNMFWWMFEILQNGGRRRAAIRAQKMDSLLRKCDVNHFLGGFVRIRSDPFRVWKRGTSRFYKMSEFRPCKLYVIHCRTEWKRAKHCSKQSSHIHGSNILRSFSFLTRRIFWKRKSCIHIWSITSPNTMVSSDF